MFVNITREMINFEPGKMIEGVVFSCKTSHQTSLAVESLWLRGRALERGYPKVRGSIPHGNSEFFLCATLVTRRKNVSHYIIITLSDKISWDTSPEQRLWSFFTLSPLQMLLIANVSMPSSRPILRRAHQFLLLRKRTKQIKLTISVMSGYVSIVRARTSEP